MPRHLACGMLLALSAACRNDSGTAPAALIEEVKSRDGVALKASYFPSANPGPGILLFHQCNMDRHAWDGLAGDLTAGGFHVLTFDRRGFGESGGNANSDDRVLEGDADAMFEHLRSRPGVDREWIAAGGASCGVDDSLDLAARHPVVTSLVLLSGYANESRIKYIATTPGLAIFGAVSQNDHAGDIEAIVRASSNPNSVVKVYPGSWLGMLTNADHGVSMFRRNPDLRPAIVHWLQQRHAAP